MSKFTMAIEFAHLPDDVIALIMDYLDAQSMGAAFRLTCRRFKYMASDVSVWKVRLQRYVGASQVPPCLRYATDTPATDLEHLMTACWGAEKSNDRWTAGDDGEPRNCRKAVLSGGHIGDVDAVHMLSPGTSSGHPLIVSGSRDRSICVWSTESLSDDAANSFQDQENIVSNCRVCVVENAHAGWIWSLASSDNRVYSGSWDCKVSAWHLRPEGSLETCSAGTCSSPALCVFALPDCVYAGTYGRQIQLFDPRHYLSPIASIDCHSKSVLSLAASDNFLYSCSEDKSITSIDLRTRQVVDRVVLPAFALTISLRHGLLYAGDRSGSLHAFDVATRSGRPQRLVSKSISSRKIVSLSHDVGSVAVATAGKQLLLRDTSLDFNPIPAMLEPDIALSNEPACVAIEKNVLACAMSESGAVHVWRWDQ